MANIRQAKKRAKQAVTRRHRNFGLRSKVRTHIKKAQEAIDSEDKDTAREAYKRAAQVIDQVANKGVLHKNAAARHKSRLNARVRALG
ncbi:MAG: 30S ribosomal protein S20 [Acidiferrobacterales bacterium]